MTLDGAFSAVSGILLFVGWGLLVAFAALSWWNLRTVPRELVQARAFVDFDRLSRGFAWFGFGFLTILVAHVPLLLRAPLTAPVLFAGSVTWIACTGISLRLFYRSIRIPREIRERLSGRPDPKRDKE